MLKQVSASLAAPAPPPATKFCCESGVNPPPVIVTVAIPAAPVVAVTATALPAKLIQDMLPAVPTVDPSS